MSKGEKDKREELKLKPESEYALSEDQKEDSTPKSEAEKATETQIISVMNGSIQNFTALGLSEEFDEFPDELKAELAEGLSENMEGVIPQLSLVKILHAGTLRFQMPDEELVQSFEGIVVDHTPANAWWEKSFAESGGGVRPSCSSLDGVTGFRINEPEKTISCATCPSNQFGSEGRGKACKNMKRIAVLIPGHLLPFRLTAPPTSIKAVDSYLTALTDLRRPFCAMKTEFSLERGISADGFEFSLLVLRAIGIVTPEEFGQVASIRKMYKQQIRAQKIEAEEYIIESEVGDSSPLTDDASPAEDEGPPF